jgi:glycerol-3-phosphate acyltransferase PlsY
MIVPFIVLLAYLLGSIPFGLLLTRAAGLGDIRAVGSGNIGATNVLRTGNKKLAALTLLLDGLKGLAAVLLANVLIPGTGMLAGLVAILGHVFPVWLKFKGGKGVATALGVLLGLSWVLGLLVIVIWIGIFKWKRISSLSAICGFGSAPLIALILGSPPLARFCVLLFLLLMVTHRANIRRLLKGEEHAFRRNKKDAANG